MKKAIKTILEDDHLRKKLTDNGLKKIKEEYLWEDNIKNFKLIYKDV